MKEEKKAGRFDMFMEMQRKKLKFEERKVAVKAASEEQKLLFVKAADLDPNATKFVQDFHATMYKHFAQKNDEKSQKLRCLVY